MSQLQERLLLLLAQLVPDLAQKRGGPRRNTCSYRRVIELAQKRGYAYMYVLGEWMALLNRQKQQPFKSSNRLSAEAIGPGGEAAEAAAPLDHLRYLGAESPRSSQVGSAAPSPNIRCLQVNAQHAKQAQHEINRWIDQQRKGSYIVLVHSRYHKNISIFLVRNSLVPTEKTGRNDIITLSRSLLIAHHEGRSLTSLIQSIINVRAALLIKNACVSDVNYTARNVLRSNNYDLAIARLVEQLVNKLQYRKEGSRGEMGGGSNRHFSPVIVAKTVSYTHLTLPTICSV